MRNLIDNLFISAIIILVLFPCTVLAQGNAPLWLDGDVRSMQYSQESYYTGFSEVAVGQGNTQEQALDRAKQKAMAELSDRVRVMVSSSKTSMDMSIAGSDMNEQFRSKFSSIVNTTSFTEVTGSKVESYYDSRTRTAYAFAFVEREELAKYYAVSISFSMQQLEGMLKTAKQFEENNEKSKARKQYEETIPLLAKIVYAQDVLVAVRKDIQLEHLQLNQTIALQNEIAQALARTKQSTLIHIKSEEEIFGVSCHIIANKLQGELAKHGCSFTENAQIADFILKVNASTRKIENENTAIVFSYGDVVFEIYDNHKQQTIYKNEIAQKGGSSTYDRAGRKAFEDVVPSILEELLIWIND